MPELPEVHTTTIELKKLIKGKKIVSIWSNYNSPHYKGKKQIKDSNYFTKFKKEVIGKKILDVRRRAKNVLIDIEGSKTILIHMKMTGHLLYGKYKIENKVWTPCQKGPLNDKMNGWIRLVFTLSNHKHLVLSDMRKFAKVTLEDDTKHLGPEPLEKKFTYKVFEKRISKKPKGCIKTVLMNQELIAGIGNIYSDEALWFSQIHPQSIVSKISEQKLKMLYKNTKKVLQKGINLSGDSMSDYRRPDGSPGKFQLHHKVYQRKNMECKKGGCVGKIKRIVVNGRSAHFCPDCQKLL